MSSDANHGHAEWDLQRHCSAFDAVLGLNDLTSLIVRYQFEVWLYGVRVYTSGDMQLGQAAPVHIDVTGALRLALDFIDTTPEAETDPSYSPVAGDARITCTDYELPT